jgi:hypothetical protein
MKIIKLLMDFRELRKYGIRIVAYRRLPVTACYIKENKVLVVNLKRVLHDKCGTFATVKNALCSSHVQVL